MKIFAEKLAKGDEVRVIAPSRSLKIISADNISYAVKVLESLGLKVTFGKHVNEEDTFQSSSISSRIEDLHDAFHDKNVKAILAVIGGSNANQLLKYIDYDLIKSNPKIFCGFSDITALQNAIYHKTGLVTYSGPQFSSFAMKKGFEYTRDFFKKIFFDSSPIHLTVSETWSNDAWFSDQENRIFHVNEGYWIIHPGDATGTIVGGNLSTIQLLHGTAYMPSFKNTVLFLEADSITEGACVFEFDRDLQSLIHQPYFDQVKALIIGRFEQKFSMDLEKLTLIINSKQELNDIPVIANADFGHTTPIFTFPIGGLCVLKSNQTSVTINLIEH
ncbi:peptidase S66 [Candidatus Nucleicultrix amoebiphila FS5]|jgi:muramoyltetrapeptide carboxypeptidase LdcA involved in peptidoglycan recycling|uniref:Peptidase S66 n=1 Tax=Candidatus Nucleicultrix amoebiphila FS5 TaxID=1414854 RepID=A0A1W6N3Z1_9PROT|nr:S66 peptidase family protein [Candidatus Nucleicultrix amoebiphila]ARN84564.1 peptidase S66 [Candidatus Nucleicultrix amoebiphila FS5]